MAAPGTAQAQKPVGKDAAFEKRVELVFDKLRQARGTLGFDFGEERFEMFLHREFDPPRSLSLPESGQSRVAVTGRRNFHQHGENHPLAG